MTHFLLVRGKNDAGTVSIAPVREKPRGYGLTLIGISPEWQGQGVGKILVREAEKLITSMGGETVFLKANFAAVGFYESCGYRAENWDSDPRQPNLRLSSVQMKRELLV